MSGNGDSLSGHFGGISAADAEADEGPSSGAATNPKLRKRTKTGCLTCRKRRIKCGEERPTCGNCIKSKRHCEGYNQRVIFKPPLGDWPGIQQGTSNTLQYHNGMLPASASYQRIVPPPINTQDAAGFTPLQPRPPQRSPYDENGQPLQFGPPSAGMPYMSTPGMPMQSPQTPLPPAWTPITPQYGHPMFPQESPMSASTQQSFYSQLPTPLGPPSGFVTSPNIEHGWQRAQQLNGFAEPPTPSSSIQQDWKPFDPSRSSPTPGSSTAHSQEGDPGHFSFRPTDPSLAYWETGSTEFISVNTNMPPQFSQQPAEGLLWPNSQSEDVKPKILGNQTGNLPESATAAYSSPTTQAPSTANGPIAFVGTTADLLEQAAVEYEDDDYFDVQSDEEMEVPPDQTMVKLQENQRDFGMIMALHREHSSELAMRRYDTFIYDGIMDHYRAEWVANPLRNPKTARVFAHFIFATGPTLSIFERKPRNASAMFTETPVPNYHQGLWTYILPMMALNHQGLLHAMLALASLHIAKLQNTSVTPSYKHYAYALKRIHHCVGNPKKRHMPTTIAATLLLGFYEVMTADHLKWSSHLAGAKQLIVEIDYQGMTKEYRRVKAETAVREQQSMFEDSETALQERNPNRTFKDLSPAIDEGLVSTLLGRKLKYDEYGRVVEDSPKQKTCKESTPASLDISKYELYQDLFWWYARQDTYQAIISGNRLLLDYCRWGDCPPRASMGRADAVYGTHDHLILLLGRIADFTARDRSRKIKVMEANGGHWRPPPNADFGSPSLNRGPLFPQQASGPPGQGFPQGPPGHMPQQAGGPKQMPPPGPPPQAPAFFGMAPTRATAQMPSSYAVEGANSTPSPQSDKSDYDLDLATQSALEEWSQIRAALNTFKSHFGPQFQPMPAELHQPIMTPFGPALQYRSYDVANLWGLYYMSYIIALRSHPHMPPAAMMAAGIAAQQTAQYAQLIGQIAGGIVPPHPGQPLNPSLGASLCEISMPLFFAGITYQDAAQRNWLVRHVRDIESRTGWASVGMIAQGCETAWVKAYEAGRGPPYTRTKEVWHAEKIHDPRVTREGGHFSDADPDPSDLSDRRWASTNAATRVHWAMGLLSMEEDLDERASRHVSGVQPSA